MCLLQSSSACLTGTLAVRSVAMVEESSTSGEVDGSSRGCLRRSIHPYHGDGHVTGQHMGIGSHEAAACERLSVVAGRGSVGCQAHHSYPGIRLPAHLLKL